MLRNGQLVLIALIAFLFGTPLATTAQTVTGDDPCRELESELARLRRGAKIKVVLQDGEQYQGAYHGLEAGNLVLIWLENVTSLPCETIESVWQDKRRFWTGMYRGAIYGMAAGMGVAAGLGLGSTSEDTGMLLVLPVVLPFVTSLVGGGVGTFTHHWVPVFPAKTDTESTPRDERIGTVYALMGIGQYKSGDPKPAALAVSGGARAWLGRVFSVGPEFGYADVGDKKYSGNSSYRHKHWFSCQVQAVMSGHRLRFFTNGGAGAYFGPEVIFGINAGGGASYVASHAFTLLGEFRYHHLPSREISFVTASVGIDCSW